VTIDRWISREALDSFHAGFPRGVRSSRPSMRAVHLGGNEDRRLRDFVATVFYLFRRRRAMSAPRPSPRIVSEPGSGTAAALGNSTM